MTLTEHTLDSTLAYQGQFLAIRHDTVRLPDGRTATREYLNHPGAVAIFALTADQSLLMVRQYRYPVRQTFLEIPAGKIDPNESPLATAKRELAEETGYTARRWTALPVAHACIGYSDERIAYFVAEDLVAGEAHLDEGEFLQVLTLPLTDVQRQAAQGTLTDSKTLVGLYWLHAWQTGVLVLEPTV